MSNPLRLLGCLLLVATANLMTSCQSVTSNEYQPHDDAAMSLLNNPLKKWRPPRKARQSVARVDRRMFQGIPYHLPMAIMTVSVDVSRSDEKAFEDLTMKLGARFVPDEESLYYLNPSFNSLFESHDIIKVSNGLLTSVDTTDDGKVGDLVTSLVSTALDFKKAKAAKKFASAQSATTSPFLTDSETPTSDEVQHALGLLEGDSLTYIYSIDDTGFKEHLPGTKNLLYLQSTTTTVGDATKINPRENQVNAFGGVFTRTLQRANTTLDLYLEAETLKEFRTRALTKAIASKGRTIESKVKEKAKAEKKECIDENFKELKAKRKRYTRKLEILVDIRGQTGLSRDEVGIFTSQSQDLKEQRTDVIAAIGKCEANAESVERIVASIATLEKEREKFERLIVNNNTDAVLKDDHLIKHSKGVVLIPNRFQTVRVPIQRALLGQTVNKLTFTDGVLVSYDSKQPSAGVEIATALGTLASKIVLLPAELIQLKIDTTGKKTSALEGELALLKKTHELEKETSETATEIRRLEAEVALVKKLRELDKENVDTSVAVKDLTEQLAEFNQQKALDDATAPPDAPSTAQRELDAANEEKAQLEIDQQIARIENGLQQLLLQNSCNQEKISHVGEEDFVPSPVCSE